MSTSNQDGRVEHNGQREKMSAANGGSSVEAIAQMPDNGFLGVLDQEIEAAGGEFVAGPEYEGSIGRTMFDLPQSKDNIIPVLLPREMVNRVPSQSLVCIKSLSDNREYRGIVVEGPFHDPDGLRADAPVVITTTVRGATFMPNYHGRVMVEIIGEMVRDEESASVIRRAFVLYLIARHGCLAAKKQSRR